MEKISINVIARMHSDFATKFGIPRQSGLVEELRSTIVFEPEYRNNDALRGIEDFSHLWIIWQFSEAVRQGWSPTVRPPRLGGNTRMGVFATRSPYRPNPIGLSSVKIEKIDYTSTDGPVIYVSGADMMDNTPIYDIKPYLPYTDSHPDAQGGFALEPPKQRVEVEIQQDIFNKIPDEKRNALIQVLEQDPRPAYQNSPERVYGFEFSGMEIRFRVEEDILTVVEIIYK